MPTSPPGAGRAGRRRLRPASAEPLVTAFCTELRALGLPVATGEFGATMAVHSVNDGPLTLLVETPARP